MLEELGGRFDLVVEAVSGFGGRLDQLRDEVFGQFAEVGSQVRFLSDQIAENRSHLTALGADFGAEMVRLGETLGRTRVEFREQLAAAGTSLRGEIAASAESAAKKLGAELKQTSRALASLGRKLERFDDRVTIQVRDQEQRLKKVEGRGRR